MRVETRWVGWVDKWLRLVCGNLTSHRAPPTHSPTLPPTPLTPPFHDSLEEEQAAIKKEYLHLKAQQVASDYKQADGEHMLHQGRREWQQVDRRT